MTTEAALDRRAAMVGLTTAAAAGADVSSMLAYTAAGIEVDECQACPLGLITPDRAPYSGGPLSSIMVLNDMPPSPEAEDLLDAQLEAAGIGRAATANVVCCAQPLNDFNVAVQAGAPEACRPHLDRALALSGAWLVVEVGGNVASEFGWHGNVGDAVGTWRWRAGRLHTTVWHPGYLIRMGGPSSSRGKENAGVLRAVRMVADGLADMIPDAPYTSQVASSIGSDGGVDMVRSALTKSGYVPIHSHVLNASVVVYDPERVTPMSSIKLPPGFNPMCFFTVNELARLKHPIDVQRVAALKAVMPNVEVVA